MVERGKIAGGIDGMRLHIFLVFIIMSVDLFPIFVAFCSVPHIGSLLVANQDSTNKTSSKVVNVGPLALGTLNVFY